MTLQRRRGEFATFYPASEVVGQRGNILKIVDFESPVEARVWEIAERSSKAEVPGQQQIDVIRVGVKVMPNIDVWAQARFRGLNWDVAAPPSYRRGSRQVRHYSILLRRRPDDGGASP